MPRLPSLGIRIGTSAAWWRTHLAAEVFVEKPHTSKYMTITKTTHYEPVILNL